MRPWSWTLLVSGLALFWKALYSFVQFTKITKHDKQLSMGFFTDSPGLESVGCGAAWRRQLCGMKKRKYITINKRRCHHHNLITVCLVVFPNPLRFICIQYFNCILRKKKHDSLEGATAFNLSRGSLSVFARSYSWGCRTETYICFSFQQNKNIRNVTFPFQTFLKSSKMLLFLRGSSLECKAHFPHYFVTYIMFKFTYFLSLCNCLPKTTKELIPTHISQLFIFILISKCNISATWGQWTQQWRSILYNR